ncbi:hypothetical protein ABEB36_010539 [Hypothenemus hampei]|uniref:Uncharacterized protein n=1 Tax=Hypothenemus hampei TaxID=57062 RepID=A0ABD1EK36_HYPHA
MDVSKEFVSDVQISDIYRLIFNSCDINSTNMVPVSKLVEFIKPYFESDLNALEDLRASLDPDGKDVEVYRETFYDVMASWSQKLSLDPSNLRSESPRNTFDSSQMDNKDMPYTHSTPRQSIGDRLLNCIDLLNLSNASGYSLSTSQLEQPGDSEIIVLEERIKKLEYQWQKATSDLSMIQQQLVVSEEQNEQLQSELQTVKRRLQMEQQTNENFQNDLRQMDEMREELQRLTRHNDELKKKLSLIEKDNFRYKIAIAKLESDKLDMDNQYRSILKLQQDRLDELFDVKNQLELKESYINELKKVNAELTSKYMEQRDLIDQLKEENLLIARKSPKDKIINYRGTFFSKNKQMELQKSTPNRANVVSIEEYGIDSDELSPILCHSNPDENCENDCVMVQDIETCPNETECLQAEMRNADLRHSEHLSMNQYEKVELQFQIETLNSEMIAMKTALEQANRQLNGKGDCHSQGSEVVTDKKKDAETQTLTEDQQIQKDATTERQELDSPNTLNKAKEEIRHLETRLKQFMEQHRQEFEHSEALKKSNLELMGKCNKLNNDLLTYVEKYNSHDKSLIETRQLVTTLTQTNKELGNNLENLSKAYSELENTIICSKTSLGSIDSVTMQISNFISKKNDVIGELKKLNEKLESDLSKSQLELHIKVDDVLNLKEELDKANNVKNKLWTQMKTFERELIAKKDEIHQLKERLAQYNSELSIKSQEYNVFRNELEAKICLLLIEKTELEARLESEKKIQSNLIENESRLLTELEKFDNIAEKLDDKSSQLLKEKEALESKLKTEKLHRAEDESRFSKDLETFNCVRTELETKISQLLIDKEELEQSLANERKARMNLAKKASQNLKELETSNNVRKELEEKISELHVSKKELETLFANEKEVRRHLAESESQNLKELETSNKIKKKLEQDKKELEEQLETEKQVRLHIEKDLNGKIQLLCDVSKQKEEADAKFVEAQRKINKIEDECSRYINEMLNQNKKEIDGTMRDKQKIALELSELKVSNERLLTEISLNKEERDIINNELLNLEQLYSSHEQQLQENKILLEQFSALKIAHEKLQSQFQQSEILTEELTSKNALLEETLSIQYNDLKAVRLDLEKSQNHVTELIALQANNLNLSRDENRKKANFNKQEIMIDRFKDKIEKLEEQLVILKNENQRLKDFETLSEELKNEIESLKKLNDNLKKQIEIKTSKKEIETQMLNKDTQCENKPKNKFTLSSDLATSETLFNESTREHTDTLSIKRSSYVLEVPISEISFDNDIVEQLELDEITIGAVLNRKELEKKIILLTDWLVANSSNSDQKVENLRETYRRQYEDLFGLIADISYRLRDHVCIGTTEPIVPVYVQLEELKSQLKKLIQNGNQICKNRMRKCMNLVISYLDMLRKENESPRDIDRESSKTEIRIIKRKNRSKRDPNDRVEELKSEQRHSPGRRCDYTVILCLVLVFVVLVLSLGLQFYCRLTVAQDQYCPLDSLVKRTNIRPPPM